MDREDLIDRIAAVLVSHDALDGSSFCLCRKALYMPQERTLGSHGAMSLRRHRAECIVDALGLDLKAAT